ncbi:hypothetical protein [Vibrio alfacsensis]|uniref:hypothetical protein n=1 Tax=Vibrio alfacsensis TaxID=1074311 RepID=UPI0040676BF1
MEKYQSYKSIVKETDVRKMQRILRQLLEETRHDNLSSQTDARGLTRESQKRLMMYKEVYLHRSDLDEGELKQSYDNMTLMERAVADRGIAALTYIIDALDKEL